MQKGLQRHRTGFELLRQQLLYLGEPDLKLSFIVQSALGQWHMDHIGFEQRHGCMARRIKLARQGLGL